MKKSISPLTVIFVTVLVDMLSFGVVIPDLQLRLQAAGASGFLLGAVLSVFSLAQFIVSPFMGRWSDRVGRRPVLALGASLNAMSYLVYAFAHSIPVIGISRILGGVGSSNLSAAFAYVADNSEPQQRAKSMGMLGAAFGLGFVFGPPIGGLLVQLGGNFLLGMFSFGLAAANTFFILRYLPETHKPSSETEKFKLSQLLKAVAVPGLGPLLLMYFAYNFGFSNMESTFVTLANVKFGFEQLQSGMFLGVIGIMIAIVQGLLVGPLTKRFGERNLARIGVMLVAPSLAFMPFAPSVAILLFGSMFLCFGSGVSMPSVQSLISRSAAGNIQGGVFGITQGLGALARILGPLSGQTSFSRNYHLPYLIAGGVVLIPVLIAWFAIPKEDSQSHQVAAHEASLPESGFPEEQAPS